MKWKNKTTPRHTNRNDGLRQNKALGQVFLHDDAPCQTIARTLVDWGVTDVLEIGPGKGVLTRHLLQSGLRVTAVEKDERFAAFVREHSTDWMSHKDATFAVEEGDFLEFSLEQWHASDGGKSNCAVVGNIPYNISSPIILKCLPNITQYRGLIFLTQLEFAERLAASAGTKDYGSLSVLTALYGECRIIEKVPRTLFTPVPKVDSAIITVEPLAPPHTPEQIRKVEMVSRQAFHQRRKKLSNSISPLVPAGFDLSTCPIDLNRRAETLTLNEFKQLANFLRP